MRRATLLALTLLAAGACGYTDEGSGTHTLQVVATGRFRVGDADGMRLEVEVNQSALPVDGATVTMKDGDTGEQINLDPTGNSGRYRKDVAAYRRFLELAVSRTGDNLEAKLEGPGTHVMDEPKNGAAVPINAAIDVAWSTEDGVRADAVVIELDEEAGNGRFEDRLPGEQENGSYEIPEGKANVVGAWNLDVNRRNELILAGGAGGSTFTIEYTVRNPITVNP